MNTHFYISNINITVNVYGPCLHWCNFESIGKKTHYCVHLDQRSVCVHEYLLSLLVFLPLFVFTQMSKVMKNKFYLKVKNGFYHAATICYAKAIETEQK